MFLEAPPIDNKLEWTISRLDECTSTNDIAQNLPSWHAVIANRQVAGRGRFGRTWQSTEGGVWMSAVVPAPIQESCWKMMPLAAGQAVAASIKEWGIPSIRLRWPNDVMIGTRKCAGILVDRFHSDRCVVGIGVNVLNNPAQNDPTLKECSIRLADLIERCPSVDDVAERILKNLTLILNRIKQEGTSELIQQLDMFWKIPTPVEITINQTVFKRLFYGVNHHGRILLKREEGALEEYAPEDIQLMREI